MITGRRCIVDIYFSDLKRGMGEIVKAKRPEYIAQEIDIEAHSIIITS